MPDYTQYATNFWQKQPQGMAGAGSLPPPNWGGGIQPLGGQQYGTPQVNTSGMTPGELLAYKQQQQQNMASAGGSPLFSEVGGSGYGALQQQQRGLGQQQGGGNGSMLALMQQLGMGMGGIPQFTPSFNFQQPTYQRQGLGQQMAGGGAMPAFLQQLMQQYGNRGGLLGGGQRPPGASVGLGMPAPQGNPYRTAGGVSDPTTNTQIGNQQMPAGGMYSPTQGGAWQGTDAQLAQFLGPQSAAQQQYMAGGNNYLDEYNARRAARGLSTQPY